MRYEIYWKILANKKNPINVFEQHGILEIISVQEAL